MWIAKRMERTIASSCNLAFVWPSPQKIALRATLRTKGKHRPDRADRANRSTQG
jgi:hypothetical protein